MISKHKVVAYSLLAYINDTEAHIKDLIDIFIPLLKRSLLLMRKDGVTKGVLEDIKKEIDSNYFLDIPYPILRKMLYKIKDEQEDDDDFIINDDDSFIIHKFGFVDLEDEIQKQESEVEEVEEKYNEYLKTNGINEDDALSIFDYLEHNRQVLSKYCAHKSDIDEDDVKFINQANFINSIKSDTRMFDIIRRIYFGAIITSYLEIDIDCTNQDSNVELVLDTSFIISLLGLASEESYHTCQKVIDISNKLGYTISILDITIDEAQALIRRVAEGFRYSIFTRTCAPEGIECAAERNNMGKTDLETIANNMESKLQKFVDFKMVQISDEFLEEAKSSDIYQFAVEREHNPDGAPHDGIARYYVTKQRGKQIQHFNEANCWFVNNSKYGNTLSCGKYNGFLFEQIKADYLVSILWLANPSAIKEDISKVGLHKLVASTVSKSMPSPRFLRSIDEKISKYADDENLNVDDLTYVANSTACISIENLEKIGSASKSSVGELNAKMAEIKKAEEKKQKERARKHQEQVEELSKKLGDKDTKLASITKEKEELEQLHLDSNIKNLEEQEAILAKSLFSLTQIKNVLEKKSQKVKIYIRLSIGVYIAILIGLLILPVWVGWNKMEWPITCWLLVPNILVFGYMALFYKKFNPMKFSEAIIERKLNKLYKSYPFDIKHYEELRLKHKQIEEKIASKN